MLLYILRTCRAPSGLVRERVLIPQKKKRGRVQLQEYERERERLYVPKQKTSEWILLYNLL